MKRSVGSLERFQPGTSRIVEVDGRTIGVINTGEAFYAVLDVCPHELAPLCEFGLVSGTSLPCEPGEVTYGMRQRTLRCPWHRYEFDLATGKALFTNFSGKLRTYPVSVERGELLIEMDDQPAD